MIIPVCRAPYRDELLYNYILWLARENLCISKESAVGTFVDQYLFPQKKRSETVEKKYSERISTIPGLDEIGKRYSNMQFFPKTMDIIKHMTSFCVLNIARSYGYQVQISQFLLRERDNGILQIPYIQDDVGSLKVCPECLEEDKRNYGEAYYHLSHHLPGVKICPRHHVTLMTIEKDKNEYLDNKDVLNNVQKVSLLGEFDAELQYANFLYELYQNPPVTDLYEIKKVLMDRCLEMGYPKDFPYGQLEDDIRKTGYDKMFSGKPTERIRKIYAQDKVLAEDLFVFIVFLFREYNTFLSYLDQRKIVEDFLQIIDGKFQLCSPFDSIVLLKCLHCGNMFHIHPYAIKIGCGCPECDKVILPEDYINKQLSNIGDGMYELMEPFKGYGVKHRILHKTCGKEVNMNISEKIWLEKTCSCEFGLSFDEVQRKVDPSGKQYRLIHYVRGRNGNQDVTLEHAQCRGRFTIGLRSFIEKPFCRKCYENSPYRKAFAKQVYDLVGNEYKIVKPYVNEKTAVQLEHTKCGTITETLPDNFLLGKRCELCTPIIKKEDMKNIILENTGGNYKVVNILKNSIIVRDMDGFLTENTTHYFMQELMRPTPSVYFKVRTGIPQLPERLLGKVYLMIKEWCKDHRLWIMADHIKEDEYEDVKLKIWTLIKNGYIYRITEGVFSVYNNVSFEDYIEERYLKQNDNITGLYAYESAAWHYAGIGEQPKEEYIFYNDESSPDARKIKTLGKCFRVRKSPVPITRANQNILIALNLLLHLSKHPEDIDAVKIYFSDHNVTLEDMRYYIGLYPNRVKKVLRELF
ncbi:TniQ family protein [Lacrimispora sp. 210928-DFI.3.58]|uniref:TniQ family protein n=1 Tax=Lacrimispora sp. 210928-DFI.3.58 TaxID=2883214 RepID=UPI001D070D43|nr:TniQ family protein [Lacrimispora sp. 210928-DFI.3.58]MCB7319888.1 TniQ family protein [Lacrimispora sp. 210928-DFI.3.58]